MICINDGQVFFCKICNYMLCQVGAAYITNEQCISGNDTMFFSIFINQQICGALHGMTWCMYHFYFIITHIEKLVVFCNDCIITGFCCWAKNDGCTSFLLSGRGGR